jgi:predicted MFS family arabinose efflux permease
MPSTIGERSRHLRQRPVVSALGHLPRRFTAAVGGPARRRWVVALACVLALDSADKAAVGAVASQLESSLRIGDADVGLLVSASSIVAALATVPFGVLVDRAVRTRLLAAAIAVWSVTMVASAAAPTYLILLVTQLVLGTAIAAAGPAVASLTGDLFPADERARIYGFILAGELVGTGVGFVVSGDIAAASTWRAAFIVLAVPGLVLAWHLRTRFPEPARGGPRLGAAGEDDAASAAADTTADLTQQIADAAGPAERGPVRRADPTSLSLLQAVRYVLRVRTNVVLIVATSLGYFFFSGLRAFGAEFIQGHYGLGQAAASSLLLVIGVGAIIGVLTGGRVADAWIRRGRPTARVVVGAAGFIAAAALLAPAVASRWLVLSLPLYVLAAAALAAPNPPLDAARLDVMPSWLWGRAESVRTVLRAGAEAVAPLTFGFTASWIAGSSASSSPGGDGRSGLLGFAGQSSGGAGLTETFLIMLVPLAVSGLILLAAIRCYPSDVAHATAAAG